MVKGSPFILLLNNGDERFAAMSGSYDGWALCDDPHFAMSGSCDERFGPRNDRYGWSGRERNEPDSTKLYPTALFRAIIKR